jgi:hypothetical protein
MAEREVKQPLVSYRDLDGQVRHALLGEKVDVHPDHTKEFDDLNGGPPEPKRKPARKT